MRKVQTNLGLKLESELLLKDNGDIYDRYLDRVIDGKYQPDLTITKEQLISNFKRIVQERLDTKAREKGYDDIVSACSYAGYANDFHDEAVQFGLWRSRVWKWGYSLLEQYKDTNASELSIDELLKGMPEFEDVANNH